MTNKQNSSLLFRPSTDSVSTRRQQVWTETTVHFLLQCKTINEIRKIYINTLNSVISEFKECDDFSKYSQKDDMGHTLLPIVPNMYQHTTT